jgi:hypothetical protein
VRLKKKDSNIPLDCALIKDLGDRQADDSSLITPSEELFHSLWTNTDWNVLERHIRLLCKKYYLAMDLES